MLDEILSYREMCNRLNVNTIQRGMNFRAKDNYSIILMSIRPGAPYNDEIDEKNNLLIYEGHDATVNSISKHPKQVDQPLRNNNGSFTQNGKFVYAIDNYKKGNSPAEKVAVYEKLESGVWSEKGLFELIDYKFVPSHGRKVFKFYLKPIEGSISSYRAEGKNHKLDNHDRMIPTAVKVAVWKRDKGQCVICGSNKNIHFDHDLPFSKGGASITEENIRILCAKCNLTKSDKIE